MDRKFIWDILEGSGLPVEFIRAVKMLYSNNKHFLRLHGSLFDGPVVQCGVRQGCPLSGLLFAICADVLLIRLQSTLTGSDEVARAFADGTAIVIADYVKSIPTISDLFTQYAAISGLRLNVKKTLFIPLWHISSYGGLRNLVREHCPAWWDINIVLNGKYLGFVIRPATSDRSWNAPMCKYARRVASWDHRRCNLLWNILYYNSFVVSTLVFVAQLELPTTEILEAEQAALRKFMPGPGNWISFEDMENLHYFGIGSRFRTIEVTARAAKLRLM